MRFARAGLIDLRAIRRRGMIAVALAAASLAAGCSLLGLGLSVVPMGLQAVEGVTEGATIAVGQSATGHPTDTKEEDAGKCEQLRSGPPYVTEVRQAADGIEIRQWSLSGTSAAPNWSVVTGKNFATSGWRSGSEIYQMDFTPPLPTALADAKARYLVFAPAEADGSAENEQVISFISFFGPADGTFQWDGRTYNYAVAQKLPCFPATS